MKRLLFNPYFVLLIGVVSLSTSAILVKVANAPSGVTAFYRLFFSIIIMFPLFWTKYRWEVKAASKKDWLLTSFAGVFLAFHFIFWFQSLNYTSVASSTILVTLQPLFAFVGAYFFFKERVTIKTIVSGLVAIGGSVIISWGDLKVSGLALWGDFLALVACALATAYFLFGQEARKKMTLITYTFLVYGISTVVLLIYVLLMNEPLTGYAAEDWWAFILLAIIPTLFGHSLMNWSIKYIKATTVSMAILLEPIGAAILAYYLLGEKIILTQIWGGLIVIGGIVLFLIESKRNRELSGASAGKEFPSE